MILTEPMIIAVAKAVEAVANFALRDLELTPETLRAARADFHVRVLLSLMRTHDWIDKLFTPDKVPPNVVTAVSDKPASPTPPPVTVPGKATP